MLRPTAVVKRRHRHHNWSEEELQCLCIFFKKWRNGFKEVAAIFNHLFVAQSGRKKLVPFRPNTVSAQYQDLRGGRGRGKTGLWNAIHANLHISGSPLIGKIKVSADLLGIRLCRHGDDITLRTQRHNVVWEQFLPPPTAPLRTSLVVSGTLVPTVIKSDPALALNRTHWAGLFFRFQSEQSGGVTLPNGRIRAKKCLSHVRIPLPEPADSDYFLHEAAVHLQRLEISGPRKADGQKKYVASPFLSVTTSFLDAFIRAYKSYIRRQLDSDIVIMDSQATCAITAMYSTASVLCNLQAKDMVEKHFVKLYKGSFERLIWGEIPASPIIRRVSFEKIVQLANRYNGILRLLRLPLEYGAKSVFNARNVFFMYEVRLDTEIAFGIGKLVKLFGIALSPKEIVIHFVYELIEDFVISAEFSDIDDNTLPERIKVAFLHGVGFENPPAELVAGFTLGVLIARKTLKRDSRYKKGVSKKPIS